MKLYRVRLTPEERAQLLDLLSKGKAAARTLTHARILLKRVTVRVAGFGSGRQPCCRA
jgi:hypothetical protein